MRRAKSYKFWEQRNFLLAPSQKTRTGRRPFFNKTKKNGSSGRTRTYNPPVNSCTSWVTANYCVLLLSLEIQGLDLCQQLPSTGISEAESLKRLCSRSLLSSEYTFAMTESSCWASVVVLMTATS